jgi:hypothetical protein
MAKRNKSVFLAGICAAGLCLPAGAFAQVMGEYGIQTGSMAPAAKNFGTPSPDFDSRIRAEQQLAAPVGSERGGRNRLQNIPAGSAGSKADKGATPPSPSDNWVQVR